MSRFANLPLAVRLATAFGAQAIALLLVTLLALNAFGTFGAGVQELSRRDVRAVSLAGEVGQHVQSIGRLATEHLYVYDGDVKTRDRIATQIEAMATTAQGDAKQLTALTKGNPHMANFSEQVLAWDKALNMALTRSRAESVRGADDRSGSRDIYTAQMSPAMERLFKTMEQLQDSIQGQAQATAGDLEAAQSSRSRVLLIVLAVSLLLATAFAVVITRSVVGPVRALMSRLRSLDEQCLTELTGGLEAAAAGPAPPPPPVISRTPRSRSPPRSSCAARTSSDNSAPASTRCSPRRSAASRRTPRCAVSSAC
jgi:hypothetical protein